MTGNSTLNPCLTCKAGVLKSYWVHIGPIEARLCNRCAKQMVRLMEAIKELGMEIVPSAAIHGNGNGHAGDGDPNQRMRDKFKEANIGQISDEELQRTGWTDEFVRHRGFLPGTTEEEKLAFAAREKARLAKGKGI